MLKDELFHLMRRLVQDHTARWQEARIPLTKPQSAVLRSAVEHPGAELTTLAAASASTKATMTEVVARLESAGLLVRAVDPADKRRRFVELTPEGEAIEAQVREMAAEVDDLFLAKLTPDERATLRILLVKLATD
jgi:MarR family transcriptional regulator, temperature-dependent positive regulator of motility